VNEINVCTLSKISSVRSIVPEEVLAEFLCYRTGVEPRLILLMIEMGDWKRKDTKVSQEISTMDPYVFSIVCSVCHMHHTRNMCS